MLEGVSHRQESRGGAQPGHHVVGGAGAHAELAQDALADHQHADGQHAKGREAPRGEIQTVKQFSHEPFSLLTVPVNAGLCGRAAGKVAAWPCWLRLFISCCS